MELIINIPDEQYNDIVKYLTDNDGNYAYSDFNLREIIRNGTPYNPSGDCISRSELMKAIGTMVEAEMPIDEKWALGLKHSLKVIDSAQAVDERDYSQGWHDAITKALNEAYTITTEDGTFKVVQLETLEGLGMSIPKRPQGKWYEYIDKDLLKARHGEYVLYKVDFLLDNLTREVYIMEGARRMKVVQNE